jgi:hypothetical protein
VLPVLTTNQKGAIAEMAIAHRCAELGCGIAWPHGDERYDLIVDARPQLLRVQCKWAARIGDVVVARLYTSRRARSGMISRRYSPGEFEAFGLYCHDVGACYLLPAEQFAEYRTIHLRLEQCRNNQSVGVNWAQDFELGATLVRLQGP